MKNYYVYIMANANWHIYVGVTSNLTGRVYQHKNNVVKGFTSKYKMDRLVYYDITNDVNAAIAREKQIKAWRRSKKVELIESTNPGWEDIWL